MFVEAESGPGALNIVSLVVAVGCAGGFFWFIRRNLLIGLGFALIGAAVLAAPMILHSSSAQANRPFGVVVVSDAASETGFLSRDTFKGGEYKSPVGRRFTLQRGPDWPSSATLIVNDSDRLVTVQRFYYSANPSAATAAPLIQVVFPGEQAVMQGYPYSLEDAGTPPPDSIRSRDLGDAIDILYRSKSPYDPAVHGNRDKLLSELSRDR